MPIKIPKKPASSNENKTLPEKVPEKAIKKPGAATPLHKHPIPFIDKISIVLTVQDEEDAYGIHSNIWTQFNDKSVFKDAPKHGKFQVSKRICLPSILNAKKWPFLQYMYGKGKAEKLRIEFSPVDLGSQGLDELQASLITIVDGGWTYFAIHGRVTMIEVTVDLPDVQVSDFHLLPQQVTTAMTYATGGQLESITLGKSRGNQTKVYDRGKKRTAKKQGWHGPPTTRVERRLKPNKPFPVVELPELENPFAKMHMVVTQTLAPPDEKKGYIWDLFLDSATVRGLPTALKLLREDKRTMYRKWLLMHPQPWWDPEAIWANWPKAYLPLLSLSGLAKFPSLK